MQTQRRGRNVFTVRCLSPEKDRISIFDPPPSFIGQRLLQLLSEWDPGNYSLFQRRLAEFQSRLDGNLAIGRELIAGLPILDLTFLTTPWLQAASGDLLRPPEDHFETWGRGEGIDLLESWLLRAQKEKRMAVADVWTPAIVKDRLANFTRSVVFPPPSLNLEWTLYLHDLYLRSYRPPADAKASLAVRRRYAAAAVMLKSPSAVDTTSAPSGPMAFATPRNTFWSDSTTTS